VSPGAPAASWSALGTSAVVLVDEAHALTEARAMVEHELDAIDRACSRFRADSEISALNEHPGRAQHVSELFLEALEAALRAADLSEGAVDPTVGEALILAGYDRDFALLQAVSTPARTRTSVRATRAPGLQSICVDRGRRTVTVPRGVRLDLGASAKALAADRAARAAHRRTGAGVLVSLGGDISVAGPPPGQGWSVRVCEDRATPDASSGQTVLIRDGGLATSSTTVRRWRNDGPAHHIIDPASGRPARVLWRTVSVAAASCVDANTAATASIVLGERALAWLKDARLPARLVAVDGAVSTVGAWPGEGA